MIIAGFWQDRKGPRIVASVGWFSFGVGLPCCAFFGDTLGGLITAYGIIAGVGVGFAYVTPIAMCIKWFPDKRGFIVGLAVMGFGVGPLLFGPLIEALIGKDPTAICNYHSPNIPGSGGHVLRGVIGSAQLYRVPPPGGSPRDGRLRRRGRRARIFSRKSASHLAILCALGLLFRGYFGWFDRDRRSDAAIKADGRATPSSRRARRLES